MINSVIALVKHVIIYNNFNIIIKLISYYILKAMDQLIMIVILALKEIFWCQNNVKVHVMMDIILIYLIIFAQKFYYKNLINLN
jgi:hypothetical protein